MGRLKALLALSPQTLGLGGHWEPPGPLQGPGHSLGSQAACPTAPSTPAQGTWGHGDAPTNRQRCWTPISNTAWGCQAGLAGPFPQSPPLTAAQPPPPDSPQAAQSPSKPPQAALLAPEDRVGVLQLSGATTPLGTALPHRCTPAPPPGRAPRSPRRAAAAGREHPAPALPWLRSLLPLPDSPALFRPVQKSKPPRLCVPQALTHPPRRLHLSVCPEGASKARPRDGASSQGRGAGGVGPTLALGSSLKQGLWKHSQPQSMLENPKRRPFRGLLATLAAGGLLGLSPRHQRSRGKHPQHGRG